MGSQERYSLNDLLESTLGLQCDRDLMPSCLDIVKRSVIFVTDMYTKVMEVYMCYDGRYYMLECYEPHGSTHRFLYRFIEVEHKMKIVNYYVPLYDKLWEENK